MSNFITDGLVNVMARLGVVGKDKAAGSTYEFNEITDEQLTVMYRSSAIAKKIIDLPAEDSMREWREWNAPSEDISKLEAEENRLALKATLIKARKRVRLYGFGAVFIGTGDADLMEPLDPERVGSGGLRYLTLLSRHDLMAGDLELDPREPFYNEPKFYRMSTLTGQLDLHPSRLAIFKGAQLPDGQQYGTRLGGDSELQSVVSEVRNLDATMANIASLVFEAKIDIIGIDGFNDGLRSGGYAYEDLVVRRTSLSARGKGNNGTLVMDAKDVYTQKSASFSTLPDVADRFMQLTSAASSIPMTLLFGMSPAGLNATGESDTRGYYDRIKVDQTLEIGPACSILDECLIRSALGNRPPELFYTWRPLWQPTTKERAETGKQIAETFKILFEMDALPLEAIGESVVNGLTESGLAPGLEAAVSLYYEENGSDYDNDDLPEPAPEDAEE